jgi:hypothetical protein
MDPPMRVAIFDRVEPPVPTELPFRLTETCSHTAAAVMLVLAVPAVLAVGFASVLLILQALFAPAMRAIIGQHPALGLEILAAIAFWAYLLGMPLKRLIDRLTVTRTVEIDATAVKVTERGRLRARSWLAPLASYTGVAHHLRASLSGTRHELILVHPERAKSVLLALADRMMQSEVDRVAALVGHKEIPASTLYRFRAQWPRFVLPTWRDPAHA